MAATRVSQSAEQLQLQLQSQSRSPSPASGSQASSRGRRSRRRSSRWEEMHAIEYDAGTQSLSKVSRDTIEENATHTKIPIPRRGLSPHDLVDLCLPLPLRGIAVDSPLHGCGSGSADGAGEGGSETERLIFSAQIRMSSLPRDVRWERAKGNVTSVYVRGVVQQQQGGMAGRRESQKPRESMATV